MPGDAGNGALDALKTSVEVKEVTDDYLADGTVSCWSCVSEVEGDQIESTVEKLQELSQDTVSDINDIDAELDNLKEQGRNQKKPNNGNENASSAKSKNSKPESKIPKAEFRTSQNAVKNSVRKSRPYRSC